MTPAVLLAVAVGAAAGSALRHLVGVRLGPRPAGALPRATLAVNVVGSAVLGLVTALALEGLHPAAAAGLGAGAAGGLTTFSTFALETGDLVREAPRRALLYVGLTLGLGVLAAAGGLAIGGLLVGGGPWPLPLR